MYAFPLKTAKENSAVAPSFCKAKYFAFYDGENLNIKRNENTCGRSVMQWLLENNVKKLIIKDIGRNPYKLAQKNNFEFYYAGDNRVETTEILNKIKTSTLEKLSEQKLQEIIENRNGTHHSHEHKHGTGHGHSHKNKNSFVFV
ncbi:dinitrogenase [Malaciobacter marinus]|jgi:predicted Fe-Mo cluster-binding NifX family protein|uniref:NifB/NifX family molybdenum-iron cluster-binding protein n=1 Tax=Malaciobacter marinus TaxID=505249 RepID=UPI0009A8983A|nr:NifB/NifX family molybdenum-iron cluster-binding protein [Malaciobacter marinus]PHO11473.1 dinitrogenase [Malaciobacter marinus]SKB25305.1 Predicted Fe-Mo cluster-binding protein, NifX family [Malaciobacter marinus]